MTLSEIGSLLAVIVAFYGVFAQRRKVSADASEINTRANVSLLKPLTDRVDELERDLADERKARQTLEDELATERKARIDLESRLTAAQQRISALEDELDKRNARIKELESGRRGTSGGLLGGSR